MPADALKVKKKVKAPRDGPPKAEKRAAAAADVSARIRYGGAALDDAVRGALDDVRRIGGQGGMIAVSATGDISTHWNSSGLKRAMADSNGRFEVGTFL